MSPPSPPLRAMVLLCGSLLADAAPAWYEGIESIHVFSPGDDVQGFSWKLYTNQTSTGQFSSQRYAFLLLPGTYRDQIAVGYYTSLAGVGETVTAAGFVRHFAASLVRSPYLMLFSSKNSC